MFSEIKCDAKEPKEAVLSHHGKLRYMRVWRTTRLERRGTGRDGEKYIRQKQDSLYGEHVHVAGEGKRSALKISVFSPGTTPAGHQEAAGRREAAGSGGRHREASGRDEALYAGSAWSRSWGIAAKVSHQKRRPERNERASHPVEVPGTVSRVRRSKGRESRSSARRCTTARRKTRLNQRQVTPHTKGEGVCEVRLGRDTRWRQPERGESPSVQRREGRAATERGAPLRTVESQDTKLRYREHGRAGWDMPSEP
ncbi:hypothetical protein DFH06DRAFT_1120612 [Mycena polygramma]|nr:hypothetical protein DFH06DRAFT_1120612 [Mycena polygramma]